MFAKIFKRLTIQAFITSFFLCFLAIFFVTYCVTAGNIDAQALIKTMFLWVAYAIIIVTISFLESRRLNQSFEKRLVVIKSITKTIAISIENPPC